LDAKVVDDCNCPRSCDKVLSTTSMITQDSPVFQTSQRVLDTSATTTVTTPVCITNDAVATESRRDELVDASIATVGKDASVHRAELLDDAIAIVNDIVAVAGATATNSDDFEIASDDDLEVAAPSVVLRLGSDSVITRGHERPIDDPSRTPVDPWLGETRRQARNEIIDHAMHLRLGELEHVSELANGEVHLQRSPDHHEPLAQRARPGSATPRARWLQPPQHLIEFRMLT
jgi:hypothetical protein